MVRRATLSGFDNQGNQIALEVSSMTYDWFMEAKRRSHTTNSNLLCRIHRHRVNKLKPLTERDIIRYLRVHKVPQPREEMP